MSNPTQFGSAEEYLRLKTECKQARARMESYSNQATALRRKADRCLEHAANLDQRVAKEQLWLDKLQSQLMDVIRQHHTELEKPKGPRNRCLEPCGKIRYSSNDDARKARTVSGGPLRPYFSSQCRCWHLTRGIR